MDGDRTGSLRETPAQDATRPVPTTVPDCGDRSHNRPWHVGDALQFRRRTVHDNAAGGQLLCGDRQGRHAAHIDEQQAGQFHEGDVPVGAREIGQGLFPGGTGDHVDLSGGTNSWAPGQRADLQHRAATRQRRPEGRREAQDYGRSVGVPEQQLDWQD